MMIRAEFFANLREKVGAPKVDVGSANTVMELIWAIDDLTKGIFADLMVEGGKPKDMVRILVNGVDIRALDGLDTRLKDKDVVSFFPPVAGG